MIIKEPPFSLEAEQGVIGALLLGAEFDSVLMVISSSDFYNHAHKILFSAIGNLVAKNKSIDFITVSDFLESRKELDDVGGLAYIADLAKNTPGISNIIQYAHIIKDRSRKRKLLVSANGIANSVFEDGSAEDKIAAAQSAMMSIDSNGSVPDVLSIQEITASIILELDDPLGAVPGFMTGFEDLDKILGGLEKGCVHIIAARPGVGKTALALNIATNLAQDGVSILAFSLEMTAKSFGRRIMSSLGGIPNYNIRSRQINDHVEQLTTAAVKIKPMKIFISETSGLGINKIQSISRFQKKVNKTEVIVIDFLQLIKREKSNKSTSDEIGEISNAIKNMAKELDVAIILLSQLNRGIESRTDKQPALSDLRSSGDIEQDAETITFLYRPIMEKSGATTVSVAKNRDGETGQCTLILNGKYSRFEQCATYQDRY